MEESNMLKIKNVLVMALVLMMACTAQGQKIALLKYRGGGDWYSNPTSLPNLIAFCNKNLGTSIDKEPATVEVGSADIFQYPVSSGYVVFLIPLLHNTTPWCVLLYSIVF